MIKRGIQFILISGLIIGCNDKGQIKNYEENGMPASGQFLNDSIKVGEHVIRYPDGKIQSVAFYNDSGKLAGASYLYYDNGKLWQKRHYSNGNLEGGLTEYYIDGRIKTKAYYLKNKIVGSVFHYHKNGNLLAYNFYDFYESNLIYLAFDSFGKVESKIGTDQFLCDSLIVSQNDVINNHVIELLILTAKIPGFSITAKMFELDKNSEIMKTHILNLSDTVVHVRLPLKDELAQLKIVGECFDSTTNAKKTIVSEYRIR